MNNPSPTGSSRPVGAKYVDVAPDNILNLKITIPPPPTGLGRTDETAAGPGVDPSGVDPRATRPPGSSVATSQPVGEAAASAVTDPAPPLTAAVVTPAEAASLMLSNPQRTAIIRLTSGATRSEAAIAAGVTRQTLYKWLKHDPAFQVAYNAWQNDLVTTAQGQLLAGTQDAVAAVLTAIRRGDARLAWKLLESQGLTKAVKAGPTDLAELQRSKALDQKRAEVARRKEINDLLHDDMVTVEPYESPLE